MSFVSDLSTRFFDIHDGQTTDSSTYLIATCHTLLYDANRDHFPFACVQTSRTLYHHHNDHGCIQNHPIANGQPDSRCGGGVLGFLHLARPHGVVDIPDFIEGKLGSPYSQVDNPGSLGIDVNNVVHVVFGAAGS